MPSGTIIPAGTELHFSQEGKGYYNAEEIEEAKIPEVAVEAKFGKALLKQQGYALGDKVTKMSDLVVGNVYCIVDLGDAEWHAGFKYNGKTKEHNFSSVLQFDNAKMSFNDKDLKDYLKSGYIAEAI